VAKRDYYEILGVARDVDGAELKRVYRELALRHHPDKNPGSREAEEHFKEVSEAYAVLSDPEKRARYDRLGHAGSGGGFGFEEFTATGFTDLFESLFGDLLGRRKGRQGGRDLRYTLELTFREAALGVDKTIRFPARRDCEACGGTGGRGGAAGLATCAECGGRGEIKVQQGFFSLGKQCPTCGGAGKVVKDACPECKGSGLVEKEREYTVAIPPGVDDGAVRRVAGQGEPGRRGGPPGDLNVAIRVKPHPLFFREGQVVACEVPISIAEAALGAVLEVPTLDGSVEMRVPAGTQTGTVFRLRGKGMPVGLRGSARGDQHVRVTVETPAKLSARQRELLAEFEAAASDADTPKRREFRESVKQLEVV
jgi:molecular chaperone DnaJ